MQVVGLEVLNGWGLTETSPVLCARASMMHRASPTHTQAMPHANVRGTVGKPLPGTEIRVVHPETLEDVAHGTPGLLMVRGPQVREGNARSEHVGWGVEAKVWECYLGTRQLGVAYGLATPLPYLARQDNERSISKRKLWKLTTWQYKVMRFLLCLTEGLNRHNMKSRFGFHVLQLVACPACLF